jgi:hypothetical protein
LPEPELGRVGKKSLRTLQERLHVRSLHVRPSKRLFAVPFLNEQQAVWIVNVLLKPNTMASRLIRHDRFDNSRELPKRQVDFIRHDLAGDENSNWLIGDGHMVSLSISRLRNAALCMFEQGWLKQQAD